MFVTYGLVWSDGEGVAPGQAVMDAGAILTPTEWMKGAGETIQILGVLDGDVTIANFSDWGMAEISDADALLWVQDIDSDAVMGSDGVIRSVNRAYPMMDAGDWVEVTNEAV